MQKIIHTTLIVLLFMTLLPSCVNLDTLDNTPPPMFPQREAVQFSDSVFYVGYEGDSIETTVLNYVPTRIGQVWCMDERYHPRQEDIVRGEKTYSNTLLDARIEGQTIKIYVKKNNFDADILILFEVGIGLDSGGTILIYQAKE